MNRLLDLCFVIGLFFLLAGLLLVAYSILQQQSGINRWSGGSFVVFGVIMMLLSRKKD